MQCLSSHSSFLLSHPKFKQNHQHLKSSSRTNLLVDYERQCTKKFSQLSVSINAITASDILHGVPASPKLDVSVFVITSVLMFIAFWITNFIIPEFITKDLKLDLTNDARDADEDTPKETETEKAERFLNSTTSLKIRPINKDFNIRKPK